MGLATKPDDQRKDDCSRQNASQDNLNKWKVDHYHVSWRWRGWRLGGLGGGGFGLTIIVASPLASQKTYWRCFSKTLSNQLTLVFRLSSMTRAPWRSVMRSPGDRLNAAS